MVFQEFSCPIFCSTTSYFTCYFMFKFKRSIISIIKKIIDDAVIIYGWVICTILPKTSRCFQIFTPILYEIIYWHYYISVFTMVYFCIAYCTCEINKLSAIFKYYFFVCINWVCTLGYFAWD